MYTFYDRSRILLLYTTFFFFKVIITMETLVVQDAASVDTISTEQKPKHAFEALTGINYGWVIVAASFLVQVVNYGVIHSW